MVSWSLLLTAMLNLSWISTMVSGCPTSIMRDSASAGDGSSAFWRLDSTYRDCSFFGDDKNDNIKDANSVIELYKDSITSALNRKRAYLQCIMLWQRRITGCDL